MSEKSFTWPETSMEFRAAAAGLTLRVVDDAMSPAYALTIRRGFDGSRSIAIMGRELTRPEIMALMKECVDVIASMDEKESNGKT